MNWIMGYLDTDTGT